MRKNKQPLCAILTDTHAKEDNYLFIEGIFDQFIELCKEKEIEIGVHCGDYFVERFPGTPLNTLLSVKRCFSRIEEEKIEFFTISGNHDKPDYTSPTSYLNVLLDDDSVLQHVNYYPSSGYKNLSNTGIRFAFLSYFKEENCYNTHLQRLIEECKKNNKKENRKTVLFTHIGINGVLKNDSTEEESGVEKEDFNFFDLVIIGHYHNRARLANGKIVYIGSTHQSNFGENEEKGFAILYDDLSLEFVSIKDTPKFKKIELQISDKEGIRKAREEYKNSQDNIRFVLKGDQLETESVDKNFFTSVGIDVRTENIVESAIAFSNIEDAEIVVQDSKTISKSWVQYCSEVKIPSDKRNEGLKLLKEEL